jgi:hypothetical protein
MVAQSKEKDTSATATALYFSNGVYIVTTMLSQMCLREFWLQAYSGNPTGQAAMLSYVSSVASILGLLVYPTFAGLVRA